MPVALYTQDWLDRVFGAGLDKSNERHDEFRYLCSPDTATLLRLTDVFEHAGARLNSYPDASVDQAFWDLGAGDGAFAALLDEEIDRQLRERFVRSFDIVFEQVFFDRCLPVLGHLSEEGAPLNSSCYIWWDATAWLDRQPHSLDSVCLESMEFILTLDHAACQESALHGLGHWHDKCANEAERIIDNFLTREHGISEALRRYALKARTGKIL